jgi:hypothetical protein
MRSSGFIFGAAVGVFSLVGSVGCSSATTPSTLAAARSAASVVVPERVGELCAGVPTGERERPFFFRRTGIEGVREAVGEQANAKFAREELRGVEITVRRAPGVTRHKVARILRCHAAWRDALGLDLAGPFEDPLTVGVPEVSFEETREGVILRIEGHDQAEGEEILRRAKGLLLDTSSEVASD